MNIRSLDYIGILGYSESSSDVLRSKVEQLTSQIVMHGMGICAGSILGPVYFAFRQAKLLSGNTRLVSSSSISHKDRHLCDILEMVSTQEEKHELIARVCIGGIIVSDDFQTKHLINCFENENKKVQHLSDINVKNLSNVEVLLRAEFANEMLKRKLG
ncbi:MAG: hypothetical protein KUG78_03055 [Kangiellaceae bacterium]|nr:hypothetical protein [Kangiellaceae bacterium]